MSAALTGLLLFAAAVHLPPVIGVLSRGRLEKLYGIAIADPDTEILMRHRAVMFGLLGGLLLAAACAPPLQPAAIAAGVVNDASYIVLCRQVGGYNANVGRVMRVDIAGLIALLAAATLHFLM